jgi:hypothetical protein
MTMRRIVRAKLPPHQPSPSPSRSQVPRWVRMPPPSTASRSRASPTPSVRGEARTENGTTPTCPAAFSVKSGDKVVVTIRNYDAAPHTFTSPRLHLNVVIKTGNARFGAPNPATTEYQVVQLRKPKGR